MIIPRPQVTTNNAILWSMLIIFVVILRAPYLMHAMQDVDEGSHAAIATAILDGRIPFKDAVNNKFPGINYTYAAVFSVFGNYNMLAVHGVTLLWTLATAAVLAYMAGSIAGRRARLWTFAFYAGFTTLWPPNLAANAEIFMALPYTVGAYLLLLGGTRNRGTLIFLGGVLAGVATIYKQAGGILLVTGALFLIFCALGHARGSPLKWLFRQGAFLVFGFVLPLGLMALYFHLNNALDDLLFWTVEYVTKYLRTSTAKLDIGIRILMFFLPFTILSGVLWVMAAYWLVRRARTLRSALQGDRNALAGIFLLLWLVSSFLVIFIGKRLYPHYYIQFLPPLSLLAGMGAGLFLERKPSRRRQRALTIGTVLPCVLSLALAIPLVGITMPAFGTPDPDFRPATEYVRNHTATGDRIFVWGFFTPLYVYSKRSPGTRFVYAHVFVNYKEAYLEKEKFQLKSDSAVTWVEIPEAWQMLEEDFAGRPPEVILDTSPGNYNKFGNFPMEKFPRLRAIMDGKYRHETTIAGIGIYRLIGSESRRPERGKGSGGGTSG